MFKELFTVYLPLLLALLAIPTVDEFSRRKISDPRVQRMARIIGFATLLGIVLIWARTNVLLPSSKEKLSRMVLEYTATSICLSRLADVNLKREEMHRMEGSVRAVPLGSSAEDLDAVCRRTGENWKAGGIVKSGYAHHDCAQFDNFMSGYSSPRKDFFVELSYVPKEAFVHYRDVRTEQRQQLTKQFKSCGPDNAFVCCSPYTWPSEFRDR